MKKQKTAEEGDISWGDTADQNKNFSQADIPEADRTVKRGSSGSDYKIVYIFIVLLAVGYVVENIDNIPFAENIKTTINDISQAVPSQDDSRPAQQDQTQKNRALEFYQAVSSGQQETVNRLLPELDGGEINTVVGGMTAVMKAASNGHGKILRLLLDNGADPNKRGSHNRTALQYAAERNRIEVAGVLLAYGADINGYDNSRLTPLTMAADRRYRDLALLLIEKGADVNVQHVQGWTALIDAAANGDLVLVKRLVKAGANTRQATPDGKTAVDFARQNGHREVETFLIQLSK